MRPRNDRRTATARIFAAALACLALAGCGPSDPLDGRVDAADGLAFSMWRSNVERDLTPQQVVEFHVMAAGAASGSDAVEAAMRQMINGLTVRQLLQRGLGWELDRAEAERSALETGMRQNALMTTRPGDTDSSEYLIALKERQTARLRAATDEVNRARERLAAAGGVVPAAPSPAP
jgi:outer membrane murein-binding lipoprotein Lpp